ncbi:caffeic acid 3-O-methyltransferase-like protein [Tanacetum coccineum]
MIADLEKTPNYTSEEFIGSKLLSTRTSTLAVTTIFSCRHGEAGIGTTLTRGITHVGGDMYDCVPQGDVIFMKWLLGNVGDDQGSKLPKNCYNAMPDDGKVILTEAILPFLSDTRSATKVTTKWIQC